MLNTFKILGYDFVHQSIRIARFNNKFYNVCHGIVSALHQEIELRVIYASNGPFVLNFSSIDRVRNPLFA
jgi:hypothetical protein